MAVDAQWQLTFAGGGKQHTMPAAELVRWGAFAEPARGPVLVLADGGLLPAEVVKIDKERLTADSDLLGTLKIPLESLSGILFRLPAAGRGARPPPGPHPSPRPAATATACCLDNGDEVTGLVEGLDGDTLRITADVGPTDVAVRRILAVIFAPVAKQPPPRQDFRAWVGLERRQPAAGRQADPLRRLAGTDHGQPARRGRRPPPTWSRLQPLGGRAVYLSDLKPAAYHHVPYLNLSWPYHTDRNVTDGLLRCGGRLYLKGLGVHSAARAQLHAGRIVSPFSSGGGH